jgi:hypothetical protein
MKKYASLLVAACALAGASTAAAGVWSSSVTFTTQVASSPTTGGGYPVPPGATKPDPGTCGEGSFNANHSESWLAVKPGTETLTGASKFFFDKYSTFYMFYLGAYSIPGGTPSGNVQIPGYDCISTGTQEMPPSWTDNTDPSVGYDTRGRVYSLDLPFNAFWGGGMHPNGAIGITYSDDDGVTWHSGNGGVGHFIDQLPNSNSLTFGHVEDKQWIAVDHYLLSPFRDRVYAMWTTFNGANGNGKIMVSISKDRGQSFSKPVQLSTPSFSTPGDTYVYPSVSPNGDVYVAYVGGFDLNKNKVGHVYVSKSTDGGKSWTAFAVAASPIENPNGFLQNTNFRDGIIENFAVSQDYPGHLYLTYEDYDPAAGTMNVKFTQSTDGGIEWTAPALVNDDAGTAATDQFQPSVAAGPGGAVAIAFYDRRAACPSEAWILPADRGRSNFCIAVSLQAYKDAGNDDGAVAVGGNKRISDLLWDPEQPGQTLGGLPQYPCAGHNNPCPHGRGFIGDYFALAVSDHNVYTLSVSTSYPAEDVETADHLPIYYQQQVLATIPRNNFGAGY